MIERILTLDFRMARGMYPSLRGKDLSACALCRGPSVQMVSIDGSTYLPYCQKCFDELLDRWRRRA